MEGLPSFDELVAARGLTSNDLNSSMKSEHTNEIAKLIGNSWEILATEIGLPPEDVHDIKEVHLHPLDRRRALMRVWEDRYGSAATYRKMAISLKKIRNRRLTEKVLDLCKSRKNHEARNRQFKVFSAESDVLGIKRHYKVITVLFVSSLFVYHIFVSAPSVVTMLTSHSLPNSNELQNTKKFNNRSHFNETFHDLPNLRSVFVDRIEAIKNITDKLMGANLVNICGAPAFGKSTVAIKTGYKLLEDHNTTVRYVNLEEALYLFSMPSHHERGSQPSTTSSVTSEIEHDLVYETNEHSVSLTTHTDYHTLSSIELDLDRLKELNDWSENISNMTVLIFDNCDSVLMHTDSLRNKFFDLIYLLIEKSQHLLHIIVVSQEKLQLLDNFEQFEVKELDEISSVELLEELAPSITRNQSKTFARLVQGCPLALKVIGKMVDLYSNQSIINGIEEELIKRPLDILNRVSDQRQQFRSIMNLVFLKHNVLNDCGYIVSLFPGSFSREAGIAVFTAYCLDAYLRQSLLDEYALYHQLRYKMHRLIKEYLRENVKRNEELVFEKRFSEFYRNFLLSYAKKRIFNDLDTHLLKSEEHNIDFYQKVLLSKLIHELSQEELAVVAFLIVNGYAKIQQVKLYNVIDCVVYLQNTSNICQYLNPIICRRIITLTMKYCYCNCQIGGYSQKQEFDFVTCMSFLQCDWIQDIYSLMQEMNISLVEETSFKQIINDRCEVKISIYLKLTLLIVTWCSFMFISFVAAKSKSILCLLYFVNVYLLMSLLALFSLFTYKDYYFAHVILSGLEHYVIQIVGTQGMCHNLLSQTYDIITYHVKEFLLYVCVFIFLVNYHLDKVPFLRLLICTAPVYTLVYLSNLIIRLLCGDNSVSICD